MKFPAKRATLPPRFDIGVDRVAHLPGPVFVMADEHDAIVAVEDFRREMELVLAGKIDGVAGALGPAEEMAVVARPAGRGIFLANGHVA